MDGFTVRQKFILSNLIEKGPLSIKDLSHQIDVSERTILREVSAVNDWLKQYKVRISKIGDELVISGNQKDIDRIRKLFDGMPPLWLLTQEQRQVLITAQLLLAKEPIKSAYFGSQFNVVEGTIIFYLDKIEGWLRTKNLKLIRRRGYGLEIIGSDWSKRNAFAELLYHFKSISELLAFLYEDNNDYSLHAFFEVTFGKKLVADVKGMIKKLYSDNRIRNINDVDNFSTFIHLLLAIERTRSNMPIELPEDIIKETLFMKECSLIKELTKVLNENGIELPESELAYLAIHLMEDRNRYSDDKSQKELGFELEDAVWEIVSITGKRLNLSIICDNQLMNGLRQHINPALYRLTMGLEVRNPIINDIKEYYKDLYEAVDYACKLVFSKYNLIIPPNEVGYVTMHIGAAIERQHGFENKLRVLVICPNGISTVKILCGKLKNKFTEIDQIDACSLREMDDKIKDNYDIILSTVDVNKKTLHDILFISPFLPDKDVEKVGELIKTKQREGLGLKKPLSAGFGEVAGETEADFVAADNMFKNFRLKSVACDTIQDTIGEIVSELHDSGVIAEIDKVERQILKREEKGSVVIPGSHVALVHIRTDEIDSPFVGVFRLEHFIGMKSAGFAIEDVDTILVMLARKNERDYILEILGKISASLVEYEDFINVLRFGDIKDIRNELIEIINREECI